MIERVLVRHHLTAEERAWYPTADYWVTPVLHCWWVGDVPHPT